jgi:hypothetical protein
MRTKGSAVAMCSHYKFFKRVAASCKIVGEGHSDWVKNNSPKFDLDAMSTEELNELLDEVMVKLRLRDVAEIKQNYITKSGRLTLPEKVANHLRNQ